MVDLPLSQAMAYQSTMTGLAPQAPSKEKNLEGEICQGYFSCVAFGFTDLNIQSFVTFQNNIYYVLLNASHFSYKFPLKQINRSFYSIKIYFLKITWSFTQRQIYIICNITLSACLTEQTRLISKRKLVH